MWESILKNADQLIGRDWERTMKGYDIEGRPMRKHLEAMQEAVVKPRDDEARDALNKKRKEIK